MATITTPASINLEGVTPQQRRIIGEALDLYSRVLMGQFSAPLTLSDEHYPEHQGAAGDCSEEAEAITRSVWKRIRPSLSSPLVHSDAREAYDLRVCILGSKETTRFGCETLPVVSSAGNPDDQL